MNTGDESIETVSKGYLSPPLILQYRKKLNSAKLKLNRNSQHYINIDCLELGLDYVELETMKLHKNCYSKKDFSQKVQTFKDKLDLYKIDKINVYLLQTEDYIKSLK